MGTSVLLLFSGLLGILVTTAWAQTGSIQVCPAPNGDFPNLYSERCSTFFRCVNNAPQLMRCPRGYRFDFNTRTCTRGFRVNCKRQMSRLTANSLLQSLYNNNNLGSYGVTPNLSGVNLGGVNLGVRHSHVIPGYGVITHQHPVQQSKLSVVNGQLVSKVVPHNHQFVQNGLIQQPAFVTGSKTKTTKSTVTARDQIPVPVVPTESVVPEMTPQLPIGTLGVQSTAPGVQQSKEQGDDKSNTVTITENDVIPKIMT